MRKSLLVSMAAMAAASAPLAAATPNREEPNGASLYQARCTGCHSLDANKTGPAHRGVYGRAAGNAPGYAYSAALKASGLVWTGQNLDLWLQGPQKLVKGTRMYLIVPDPHDRAGDCQEFRVWAGG